MTYRCSRRNMNASKKAETTILAAALLSAATILILQGACASGPGGMSGIKQLHGPVFTVKLDSSINPGSAELLKRAVITAEKGNASCLVVLLDTPGGLVTSLRKMVQDVMKSNVPVVVYVYPSGARAASAGAILTLSAHFAAMAPGTNIGAAHPVSLGQKMDANSTMAQKVENDLAAMAVSIAEKRGRNAAWAEEAVRKSRSVTASEALRLHVIDMIAQDLSDLLREIRGRQTGISGDTIAAVYPDSSHVIPIEENLREKILQIIADPNIAYVLLMVGMVGLYFELAHPGTIFPGTAGTVSLLLALYALQTLSASATGVLLVILAFVLFVLELFITSHGILAVSGVVALVLGSTMLFDPGATGTAIDTSVLWPTLVTVCLFLGGICLLAARAAFSRPRTGAEGLKGEKGRVRKVLPEENMYLVFIHGELWQARASARLREGQKIVVESVDGLTLNIKPVED